MENMIKVGMADLNVSTHPGGLVTLGLGSCVGIALYDKKNRIIGMAHIMLPSFQQAKNNSNKAKFADTALDILLQKMIRLGTEKRNIIAKIAGGAQMFSFGKGNDVIRIGERNVEATKKKLHDLNIPLVAEDTGGNYGRTIEFYSEDGKLMIKTIGHGINYV